MLQQFLADATVNAAINLEAALLSLPVEKRNWQPSPGARSALNLVAECALMNGKTIEMVRDGIFPENMACICFADELEELSRDWPRLRKLLHDNTAAVAVLIRETPQEQFAQAIEVHGGAMPLSEILSYPLWNMSYHEGQINYIAALSEA